MKLPPLARTLALATALLMIAAPAAAADADEAQDAASASEPLLAFTDLIRQAIAYQSDRPGDLDWQGNVLLVETPRASHQQVTGTLLPSLGPEVPSRQPLAVERVAGMRGARPHAHQATYARTAFTQRVELFAERQLFVMAEGTTLYGLEGGAALRLREDLDLTARYRVLGHSSLFDGLDSEISAPLLGVALRF